MRRKNAPRVNANTVLMNDTEVEDEIPNSHFTRPHWARTTTETPDRIGNIKEPMLALIDHGSEMNLMSKEFYRKGKWPINTNHGWKIRAATKATEDLFAACPDMTVKIGMSRSTKISSCKKRSHTPSSSANPLSRLHGWR